VAKTMVSAHMQRLEEELGASLLLRTTRSLRLTEAGEAFYDAAKQIVADAQAAIEAASQATKAPRGTLRVTAPIDYGAMVLAPVAVALQQRYPELHVDLLAADRVMDLVADQIDVAIRIGRLADSALVARRIAPVRKAAIASPAYLEEHGRPGRPADLSDHQILMYNNEQWRFRVGDRWETIRVAARMRTNNGEMLRAAAQAGLGIAMLPSFIAAPAIEDGSVEVILRDFPLDEGALHAVMPPGRATTARVRALVDFLVARFGPEPAWDPCWLAEERLTAPAASAGRPSGR